MATLPKAFRQVFAFTRAQRRQPDRQRLSASARGYTHDWNEYSTWFRSQPENILCACGCNELAQCTDHIIPAKPDTDLFWDITNHQALRHTCHNRKTIRFDHGHGRQPDTTPIGQAVIRRMQRLAHYRAQLIHRRESGLPRMAINPHRFVVCGPPGSGKAAWVKDQAHPGTLTWDLEAIALTLHISRVQRTPELTTTLIAFRELLQQHLATHQAQPACLIISDPTEAALVAAIIGAAVITLPLARK
jgi:hypothetical protein